MLVLHPLDAHLDLVRVGHGVVHPLLLEAGGGGLFHGGAAHVLEGRRQDGVDLVRLLEGDVGRRLARKISVVGRLVTVELLIVPLLDHVLQDLGGHLGVGSHSGEVGCHFSFSLDAEMDAESPFIKYYF